MELKRTVRHSPTEGAKPPEGAVVLFDGTTADKFIDGTMSPDKNLMSGATSKQKFGDYTLHVEFRLSYMPEARGQARSNSGVYLHDCYEIQVLDSFGLEGEKDDCGGYLRHAAAGRERVLSAAYVADLRRGLHRPAVQGRQEGFQRPGRRSATTA